MPVCRVAVRPGSFHSPVQLGGRHSCNFICPILLICCAANGLPLASSGEEKVSSFFLNVFRFLQSIFHGAPFKNGSETDVDQEEIFKTYLASCSYAFGNSTGCQSISDSKYPLLSSGRDFLLEIAWITTVDRLNIYLDTLRAFLHSYYFCCVHVQTYK